MDARLSSLTLTPAAPQIFPTDRERHLDGLPGAGPYYCELCGYDVVSRTSAGVLCPVTLDYVRFEHLPGRKWHPDCAIRDTRIESARLALEEALRGVF